MLLTTQGEVQEARVLQLRLVEAVEASELLLQDAEEKLQRRRGVLASIEAEMDYQGLLACQPPTRAKATTEDDKGPPTYASLHFPSARGVAILEVRAMHFPSALRVAVPQALAAGGEISGDTPTLSSTSPPAHLNLTMQAMIASFRVLEQCHCLSCEAVASVVSHHGPPLPHLPSQARHCPSQQARDWPALDESHNPDQRPGQEDAAWAMALSSRPKRLGDTDAAGLCLYATTHEANEGVLFGHYGQQHKVLGSKASALLTT